jgi:hypothetical protein
MRESQMKKIIALAVASAFVAPAMAAEVAISGSFEFAFVSTNTNAAHSNNDVFNDETNSTVTVTEELPNGMSVKGNMAIHEGGNAHSGYTNSLAISGASFGTVTLGDTSGALDSIDDKADVFYLHDNGQFASNDARLAWKLPTFVDGLTVTAAYSPEEGMFDDGRFDVDTNADLDSADAGMVGVALSYKMGPVTVGYAKEEVSDGEANSTKDRLNEDNTLMNIVYAANGLRVAYESVTQDNFVKNASAPEDNKNVSFAVSYTMNDLTFSYGGNETEKAGVTTSDITAYGFAYKIGSLTVFAEAADDDRKTTKDEMTAVGVKYAF